MSAGYSLNTVRNYRSAWASFERWCLQMKRTSLPATPEDCIDHSAWCIAAGFRLETVHLRLKAINHYHRQNGLPLPFEQSVREFLSKAKRSLCERPQFKEALRPAQLVRISKFLRDRGRVADKRDRALLLLCFACGWRRSEIVSLDLRDLKRMKHGLTLWLGKSKTDQQGRGRTVGVHFGKHDLTCPIRAIEEWLAVRGTWHGPLFVRLDGSRHITRERLHADGVRRAVKTGLDHIGENSELFGAHSLRSGMITAAAEAGATETSIMQRTGHRCYETIRRYVRPAQAFRADPLKGVL